MLLSRALKYDHRLKYLCLYTNISLSIVQSNLMIKESDNFFLSLCKNILSVNSFHRQLYYEFNSIFP